MENSKSVAFVVALDVALGNEVKRKRGSAVNKFEEQIFTRGWIGRRPIAGWWRRLTSRRLTEQLRKVSGEVPGNLFIPRDR